MALLPVSPPPMPGELLASWVGRLACLYDAPPDGLWSELAGSAPAEFASAEDGPDRDADRSQVARIAAAARRDPGDLLATTTRRMFPAAPATWLRSAGLSMSRVPWCPACLRDDAVRHGVPYLRRLWAAGCVVVCRRHRAPLVDTCPACRRRALPAFRWVANRPLLTCTACDAILSDSDGGPCRSDAAPDEAGPSPFVASAAVTGAGWLQKALLRVLRGVPAAAPWARDVAPVLVIPAIESLIGQLAHPLGIVCKTRRDIGGRRESDLLRCSPTEFPARAAFAVMAAVAALLALPEAELDERSEGLVWRQAALGEPIDLVPLWAPPNEGGAVLWRDREHVRDTVRSIGIAVALAVLGDPAIAAYMAAQRIAVIASRRPSKPRPEAADARFRCLAQRILANPSNAARLTAAGTPTARRLLLGRLAREALEADRRFSTVA